MVILFDMNADDDIFNIVFATPQQAIVARLLIQELKDKDGVMTKTEMSLFATLLHEGKLTSVIKDGLYKGKKVKVSYNKRQFYDRILTPMKAMGMIDYDLYKKVYKLSKRFSKELTKIGIKWVREVDKQPSSIERLYDKL